MSIILRNCGIRSHENPIIPSISLDMGDENWLVTGANGSGKSVLVSALAGFLDIVPNADGFYGNSKKDSTELISFESADFLIDEERRLDDSDFIEGGIDNGRTPRILIIEKMNSSDPLGFDAHIEEHPAVKLCEIVSILDRGIKYLSTGEIRRTLLCRALIAKPKLLILDEPYAGLDTLSRQRLMNFLENDLRDTQLIIVMDRPICIPSPVTQVLELSKRAITYSGSRLGYEKKITTAVTSIQQKKINQQLGEASEQGRKTLPASIQTTQNFLVEMKNVTVEWSERKVLDNLTWTLKRGEHWLIRGPNGSGKTTFLELITGDNPQVFRNNIWLFGKKRGSGETIWELKEKMGIVSYRLHTDYRSFGDLTLESVVLSGLHDSIGLYQQCGEEERDLAEKWLSLADFTNRGSSLFRELSYGEQRAILIARASIKQPPILILDEPCHGLDSIHRNRILTLLEKIAESGTSTLLHVTHDETEVLDCERHILELTPEETPMYRILSR